MTPSGKGKTTQGATDNPKHADKEAKLSQIRRAAYRCFSKQGYHKTTVDNICTEAGISKGSFYWYYSGKFSIFLNILDSWGKDVESEMQHQFRDSFSGENHYASLVDALERERQHSGRLIPVWIEFLSQVVRTPEVRKELSLFHRRIRTSITSILKPVLPSFMQPKDHQAFATLVLACFIGLLCLELVDPEEIVFSDILRRFFGLIKFMTDQTDFTQGVIHSIEA